MPWVVAGDQLMQNHLDIGSRRVAEIPPWLPNKTLRLMAESRGSDTG